MRRITGLVTAIAVCMGAAWLGSLLTRPSLQPWYEGLTKPSWTPPNWVFGPAWTFLFLTMAAAAWLVWERTGRWTSAPLRWFLLQLVLNVTWSALFFYFRAPGAAFVEILLLWSAILFTALAFGKVRPAAGWLLTPYLTWVIYAAALNFSIWRLNT
jgi:benzodiazapine receptor